MAWLSSGRLANPILDQVLIDTGPLAAGIYYFDAFGASTVAAAFEIQHRNAANAVNLKSQIMAVPASATIWGFSIPAGIYLDVAVNERIRIIQVVAVTGNVSVSLVGNF